MEFKIHWFKLFGPVAKFLRFGFIEHRSSEEVGWHFIEHICMFWDILQDTLIVLHTLEKHRKSTYPPTLLEWKNKMHYYLNMEKRIERTNSLNLKSHGENYYKHWVLCLEVFFYSFIGVFVRMLDSWTIIQVTSFERSESKGPDHEVAVCEG